MPLPKHEFEPPALDGVSASEITPMFIMGLFPNVAVYRLVQGNGYSVKVWRGAAGRWKHLETVNSTTAALAAAARYNS